MYKWKEEEETRKNVFEKEKFSTASNSKEHFYSKLMYAKVHAWLVIVEASIDIFEECRKS